MKRVLVGGIMALWSMVYGGELCADEAKVSGSASLGVINRYIFRGYRIGGQF